MLDAICTVETEELTVEQSRALFDREAQRLLGISGDEFLDGFRSGRIHEDPSQPGVTQLLTLLPFAEQVS
jgi:hypothetical protein